MQSLILRIQDGGLLFGLLMHTQMDDVVHSLMRSYLSLILGVLNVRLLSLDSLLFILVILKVFR